MIYISLDMWARNLRGELFRGESLFECFVCFEFLLKLRYENFKKAFTREDILFGNGICFLNFFREESLFESGACFKFLWKRKHDNLINALIQEEK